jgi:hypothetical protein
MRVRSEGCLFVLHEVLLLIHTSTLFFYSTCMDLLLFVHTCIGILPFESTHLQEEGFSPAIVDRFFRPFLGGIFFDRSLGTTSRLFAFVMRMLATGQNCLPARGVFGRAVIYALYYHYKIRCIFYLFVLYFILHNLFFVQHFSHFALYISLLPQALARCPLNWQLSCPTGLRSSWDAEWNRLWAEGKGVPPPLC